MYLLVMTTDTVMSISDTPHIINVFIATGLTLILHIATLALTQINEPIFMKMFYLLVFCIGLAILIINSASDLFKGHDYIMNYVGVFLVMATLTALSTHDVGLFNVFRKMFLKLNIPENSKKDNSDEK